MKHATDYNPLLLTSLVLASAWGIGCPSGFLAGQSGWRVGLAALVAGSILAGSAAWFIAVRCRGERQAVQRRLNALCQLDPGEWHGDQVAVNAAPLAATSPWHAIVQRVEETLVRQAVSLQEAQDVRAALEIRCQRASDQSERIQGILAGLNDPVLAIDEFDELILANPAAEEILRLGGDKPETRALAQLVRCQKLVDLLQNASHHRSAASRSEEVELLDGQGTSHWYRVNAVKLPGRLVADQREAGSGAVAVLHDIGYQKVLQKRNAEFVASVSHEMKTPLAGIKAYVELLADDEAEDEQTREEFLGVINGQADRLQRLVDNLLNLARIEAGVVKVNKQSQSLNELLEEAAHVVQPSAEAKQITLATELSPLYLGVLADRDMLLQAAINLLSNAVKYTKQGGRVTIRSRLADNEVVFEVADTGVGLSAEDCTRVFEKFYRVQKDKNMAPGTGLGLALAKHIVEDVHSGKLTVESTLGVGSTFIVTLPNVGKMP
jgi:two-component system phosphate regulon sensor histidine kinase PhoR